MKITKKNVVISALAVGVGVGIGDYSAVGILGTVVAVAAAIVTVVVIDWVVYFATRPRN